MKKIFAILALLLMTAVVAAQGIDTNVVINSWSGYNHHFSDGSNWVWEFDTTINNSGVFDTINGTSDSTRIIDNWTPKPGWQYILANNPTTDGGTGAPEFVLNVLCYDGSDSLICAVTDIDTIDDNGGYCFLGIGEVALGVQYDVWIKSGATNGAANHTVNGLWVFRRRRVLGTEARWR